jgi:hypothetical protein
MLAIERKVKSQTWQYNFASRILNGHYLDFGRWFGRLGA